jgi:hypothetical protein
MVTAMKKLLAVFLITASVLLGAGTAAGQFGVGAADAKPKASTIVPGRYTAQFFIYGAVPTPLSNARIVGQTLYQDYYGIGPRNTYTLPLTPTKRGMIASYGRDRLTQWFYRVEFRKTGYGYKGVVYNWGGIAMGDWVLRKVSSRQ